MRPTKAALIFTCAALAGALPAGWLAFGAQGASGDAVRVNIGDLAFAPRDVTVREGGTVEWFNGDFVDHTATADGTAAMGNWEVVLPAGQTGRATLHKAGLFPYYCRYHPGMTGTIRVVEKE